MKVAAGGVTGEQQRLVGVPPSLDAWYPGSAFGH
jgi:hypothetical protein